MSNDRLWLYCTAHDEWTPRVVLGKWWVSEMAVPNDVRDQLERFFDDHHLCLPSLESLDRHPWRLETEADVDARTLSD